jgi:hypothetical protein
MLAQALHKDTVLQVAPLASAPEPDVGALQPLVKAACQGQFGSDCANIATRLHKVVSAMPNDTPTTEAENMAAHKAFGQSVLSHVFELVKSVDKAATKAAHPTTPTEDRQARLDLAPCKDLLAGKLADTKSLGDLEAKTKAMLDKVEDMAGNTVPCSIVDLLTTLQHHKSKLQPGAIQQAFTHISRKMQMAAQLATREGNDDVAANIWQKVHALQSSWTNTYMPLAKACGYEAANDLFVNGELQAACGAANPSAFLATLASDARSRNTLRDLLMLKDGSNKAAVGMVLDEAPKSSSGGCVVCLKDNHQWQTCYKVKAHFQRKPGHEKEAPSTSKKQ